MLRSTKIRPLVYQGRVNRLSTFDKADIFKLSVGRGHEQYESLDDAIDNAFMVCPDNVLYIGLDAQVKLDNTYDLALFLADSAHHFCADFHQLHKFFRTKFCYAVPMANFLADECLRRRDKGSVRMSLYAAAKADPRHSKLCKFIHDPGPALIPSV